MQNIMFFSLWRDSRYCKSNFNCYKIVRFAKIKIFQPLQILACSICVRQGMQNANFVLLNSTVNFLDLQYYQSNFIVRNYTIDNWYMFGEGKSCTHITSNQYSQPHFTFHSSIPRSLPLSLSVTHTHSRTQATYAARMLVQL